ncbi:glycosyltransferase family 2 protein [Anaerocolumna sp. MB42-C2]|uniref:glycosyltransferase family 2 protein n=1 Tax=Anaerocolumna sp. MB42-C2 TaxID=3070997 RepID=UPI0027DFD757|nr:glycosyltransferase family 2 protein [Anaerocolumna sp. MB42-C2]WMJ90184.1 glycosyltransferase family 2 protein [Anaerocolumna sp. MB42-C2]
MITISACMIVKNEEKVISRCLESLKGIVDEIIIIDTGSNDSTKELAKLYTEKIYDFKWVDDFSAARNYSFSKAAMDYIYVADADEVIDEDNRKKFLDLKKALLPEIEIVQMLYSNQLAFNTTYNFDTEYRPKLYKRIRHFTWVDPIHESVALQPVIYDSDITIIHLPEDNHAGRDFKTFQSVIKRGEKISEKLLNLYARELFIAGTESDFLEAETYFEEQAEENLPYESLKVIHCVLTKCGRLRKNDSQMFKYSLKNMAGGKPSAEICYEVGEYFFEKGDYKEAIIWYYNAAYETECDLNIHYSGDYPLLRLSECYAKLEMNEQTVSYKELADAWLPS